MAEEFQRNALGLPVKQVKRWKKNSATIVSEEDLKTRRKPVNPAFCDCKDPETGEKCGNYLHSYDTMFYNQYEMCEKCFMKYNPHLKPLEEEMAKQKAEKQLEKEGEN